jgi:apolipoprotein N-acyltransferase
VQEALPLDAPPRTAGVLSFVVARARAAMPTLTEALWAVASAALLALAFPDFGLWPLAWVGLVPLLATVAARPRAPQAFVLGWLMGTLFFYATCHWLTYPMIHFAGIPAWAAYPLLLPPTLVAGLFPAFFAFASARLCARWGPRALFLAPALWAASEWARLGVIGQLWNALGYSQAETPALIQTARMGGVYAVGFLIILTNAALAHALVRRNRRASVVSAGALLCVALTVAGFEFYDEADELSRRETPGAVVVAVQPNVTPDFKRSAAEFLALEEEHFRLSAEALRGLEGRRWSRELPGAEALPRIVVWPESPMNFSFANDARLRERVARFNREHHASLIFNSLEPVPAGGGDSNAAVLVNERGELAVQYDKIRLLPFGEYVPLPAWVPGASLIRGVVGDFTPGTRYTLMPLGGVEGPRAGVFICVESAYPSVTRQFTREGADVLIEITNDAYQGDTAVLRQHLSNAVFRAVETGRPVLRVTNTGITARVTARGEVLDAVEKLRPAARVWAVGRAGGGQTFYVRHGDLFAALCAMSGAAALLLSFRRARVAAR